jgi:hypothetical protein
MTKTLMPEGGLGRKNSAHHQPFPLTDFTRAGLVIFRRTRLSPSVCNRLAELAGLGHQEAR